MVTSTTKQRSTVTHQREQDAIAVTIAKHQLHAHCGKVLVGQPPPWASIHTPWPKPHHIAPPGHCKAPPPPSRLMGSSCLYMGPPLGAIGAIKGQAAQGAGGHNPLLGAGGGTSSPPLGGQTQPDPLAGAPERLSCKICFQDFSGLTVAPPGLGHGGVGLRNPHPSPGPGPSANPPLAVLPVALGCGHVFCSKCTRNISKCPICCAIVVGKQRLFFP